MKKTLHLLPGLSLVAALLLGAGLLSQGLHLDRLGMSTAAVGILLGVLAGNLRPQLHAGRFQAGMDFAQKRLLRWGIVCFGFHLSVQQILAIGREGILVDVFMVISTLALGVWLGRRFLGLDTESALLTAVGSAICGAAAIAATAPLVKARSGNVTAAVGTVVLFGTLGMALYPQIDHWGPVALHRVFGIYVGSTVHEVAQVVAIGSGLGDAEASRAVVVKMLRVLMLMPFLLLLGWRLGNDGTSANRLAHMPWFALGFLLAAAINSLGWLPSSLVHLIQQAGGWLLAAAMAALGLGTTLHRIRAAGTAPLLLAGILFVHLVVIGGLVNSIVVG